MSPQISIVTPTFNRKSTLPDLLASLEQQQGTIEWEWIAVDDGSTDGSWEWLQEAAANDSRVRALRREGHPKGANRCRNQGMDSARGDLVVFFDSDDILMPEALANRVAAMESAGPEIDFLAWQAEIFREQPGDLGTLWNFGLGGDPLTRFFALDPPWPVSGPTWRREYLQRLGVRWREKLPSWQDYVWHAEILQHSPNFQMVCARDHQVRMEGETHKTTAEVFKKRPVKHLRAQETEVRRLVTICRLAKTLNPERRYWLATNFGLFANDYAMTGSRAQALGILFRGAISLPAEIPYFLRAAWFHSFSRSRLAQLAKLSNTEQGFLPGRRPRCGEYRFRGSVSMLENPSPPESTAAYFPSPN